MLSCDIVYSRSPAASRAWSLLTDAEGRRRSNRAAASHARNSPDRAVPDTASRLFDQAPSMASAELSRRAEKVVAPPLAARPRTF